MKLGSTATRMSACRGTNAEDPEMIEGPFT